MANTISCKSKSSKYISHANKQLIHNDKTFKNTKIDHVQYKEITGSYTKDTHKIHREHW